MNEQFIMEICETLADYRDFLMAKHNRREGDYRAYFNKIDRILLRLRRYLDGEGAA